MAKILVQHNETTSKATSLSNLDVQHDSVYIDGTDSGMVYKTNAGGNLTFPTEEKISNSSNDFASNIGVSSTVFPETDVKSALESLASTSTLTTPIVDAVAVDVDDFKTHLANSSVKSIHCKDVSYTTVSNEEWLVNGDKDIYGEFRLTTTNSLESITLKQDSIGSFEVKFYADVYLEDLANGVNSGIICAGQVSKTCDYYFRNVFWISGNPRLTVLVADASLFHENINPEIQSAGQILYWDNTYQNQANSVSTSNIEDDAVDKDKINADVAGAGLVQNVSGALDVNPDNSTLEISSDQVRIKDNAPLDNLRVDSISEKTASNGVDVDGVLLKDNSVTANSANLTSITSGTTSISSGLVSTTSGVFTTVSVGGKSIIPNKYQTKTKSTIVTTGAVSGMSFNLTVDKVYKFIFDGLYLFSSATGESLITEIRLGASALKTCEITKNWSGTANMTGSISGVFKTFTGSTTLSMYISTMTGSCSMTSANLTVEELNEYEITSSW